jgi:hypothetical protein
MSELYLSLRMNLESDAPFPFSENVDYLLSISDINIDSSSITNSNKDGLFLSRPIRTYVCM